MLIERIQKLGFTEKGANLFGSDTEYSIKITIDNTDDKKSKIDYGQKIKVWNATTSNLKQPENLVVLECVLRLLKKGYLPENIELEKTWKSGHGTSGRVDILLRDSKGKVYALVECKTWGEEYASERNNMIEDGGQLFSYFVQENASKLLVLYTSTVSQEIAFMAQAIDCSLLNGTNNEEVFGSWNKSFINESIFSDSATLYFSQKTNLFKYQLKELDKETGRGLFNSFAEILRRYAVSDKSNAFNKIFNLFVCKIYDEDTKNGNDELEFQWKVNDSYKNLTERLGKLYSRGINDYLQIEIDATYFVPDNEFSFIDIYNSDTYNKNYQIIKEVVELLQTYQIKYTAKHQFLGDFFEDLLNTGIKQEAGQFFTPTPLSRFFLKALPIGEIINQKIQDRNPNILPYIIDYACGAGHFLTEAIDEFEQYIEAIDVSQLVGRIQKQFLAVKNNFYWAKEYVYGIEKDYRLAKTTKIAMFLYGDGDAQIINGDGLGDFAQNKDFTNILSTQYPQKRLEKFDIIVSNPPFSVSNFKQDLTNGENNFSLYKFISPKSSEIECLFVERTHQLLTENGFAGIILPLSILNTKTHIYTETRKLLLLNFKIAGIVELRDKTFKPTNTTTVGLFLKKRPQATLKKALTDIQDYCTDKSENDILEDLMVDKLHILNLITTDLFNADFLDSCNIDDELCLLLVNYLNYNQKTVVAYSGEKKEQEAFLGYRYSKTRGREGFEIFQNEYGKIETALYDEQNLLNIEKVNAHIQANFTNTILPVPVVLQDNLMYVNTNSLLHKTNFILDNPSSYFESDNYIIQSNSQLGDIIDTFELEKYELSDLIKSNQLSYFSGLVYNKKTEVPRKTNKRVLTASNLILQTGQLDLTTKLIHLDENYELPQELKPQINDIVISNASGSLKHLGKVVFITKTLDDCVIGGFLSIIRCQDEKLAKSLFYRLLSYSFRKYITTLRGQNINNLDFEKMNGFVLELPKNKSKFYNEITKSEQELRDLQDKLLSLKK